MEKKRSEAELVAFHLGCDISDIRDAHYQKTQKPKLFTVGNYYFCAPAKDVKVPKGFNAVGEYYGRFVYRIHMLDRE
jgi:hypothetical protein